MRAHPRDAGHVAGHGRIHRRGNLAGVTQLRAGRQLEMQRGLHPRPQVQDAHVVHFTHVRHGMGSGEDPLGDVGVVIVAWLHVHHHVCARDGTLDGILHRIGRGVRTTHRLAGRHADDHVRERATGSRAHSQPPQFNFRAQRLDRLARSQFVVIGHPVHKHAHVLAHQMAGRDEHEHRHEKGCDGVGVSHSRPHQEQPYEYRSGAGKIAGEVNGASLERRA